MQIDGEVKLRHLRKQVYWSGSGLVFWLAAICILQATPTLRQNRDAAISVSVGGLILALLVLVGVYRLRARENPAWLIAALTVLIPFIIGCASLLLVLLLRAMSVNVPIGIRLDNLDTPACRILLATYMGLIITYSFTAVCIGRLVVARMTE